MLASNTEDELESGHPSVMHACDPTSYCVLSQKNPDDSDVSGARQLGPSDAIDTAGRRTCRSGASGLQRG